MDKNISWEMSEIWLGSGEDPGMALRSGLSHRTRGWGGSLLCSQEALSVELSRRDVENDHLTAVVLLSKQVGRGCGTAPGVTSGTCHCCSWCCPGVLLGNQEPKEDMKLLL